MLITGLGTDSDSFGYGPCLRALRVELEIVAFIGVAVLDEDFPVRVDGISVGITVPN